MKKISRPIHYCDDHPVLKMLDIIDFFKNNEVAYINAQLTLRAETLVNLDQEMSEKVLNIMEFMDDLDDVQEVHTNAEFPENFEVKD